ncbi:hypothetical protein [Montanilutibacter psychrotolerans]|uniref:hypothetical protein n=1 Tax=Montanilutibacter psychrotolerans TaxID=1327343 RepID=UPI001CC1E348|nr:hypothetical protein [Lysobacter psychrotolerans]
MNTFASNPRAANGGPTHVQRNDARLLRGAVTLDAIASGAIGLPMLLLAAPMSELLALPTMLLRGVGAGLLLWVGLLAWMLTRPQIGKAMAWTVIAINAMWVFDSIALLFSGWVAPNALGYGFVIAQAVAVLVFAELQYFGLRRTLRA